MENYLKKLGKSILNGMYSIAEGMSTLNIYSKPNIKIPTDEDFLKLDKNAMREDWKVVGDDLRKVIGISSLENEVKK